MCQISSCLAVFPDILSLRYGKERKITWLHRSWVRACKCLYQPVQHEYSSRMGFAWGALDPEEDWTSLIWPGASRRAWERLQAPYPSHLSTYVVSLESMQPLVPFFPSVHLNKGAIPFHVFHAYGKLYKTALWAWIVRSNWVLYLFKSILVHSAPFIFF